MSTNLETLEELEARRARDLAAHRRKRGEFVREREAAAVAEVERQAKAMFDADIERLRQAHVEARLALEEFRIERAESYVDAPYPKGTKFYLWEFPRFGYHNSKRTLNKDTAGVIEVVTHDTVHPENKQRYRLAGPGDYIIRILKKDGTPSKKYERIHHHSGKWHLPHNWYPEGVDPNQEKP